MVRSLQELKDNQDALRAQVFTRYMENKISILEFSRRINIPYSSLWMFLKGGKLRYKNLCKVIEWLK